MAMARRCSLHGCDREGHARGLCNAHYRRWLRAGDAGDAAIRPSRARELCAACGLRPRNPNSYCTECNRTIVRLWAQRIGSGTLKTTAAGMPPIATTSWTSAEYGSTSIPKRSVLSNGDGESGTKRAPGRRVGGIGPFTPRRSTQEGPNSGPDSRPVKN